MIESRDRNSAGFDPILALDYGLESARQVERPLERVLPLARIAGLYALTNIPLSLEIGEETRSTYFQITDPFPSDNWEYRVQLLEQVASLSLDHRLIEMLPDDRDKNMMLAELAVKIGDPGLVPSDAQDAREYYHSLHAAETENLSEALFIESPDQRYRTLDCLVASSTESDMIELYEEEMWACVQARLPLSEFEKGCDVTVLSKFIGSRGHLRFLDRADDPHEKLKALHYFWDKSDLGDSKRIETLKDHLIELAKVDLTRKDSKDQQWLADQRDRLMSDIATETVDTAFAARIPGSEMRQQAMQRLDLSEALERHDIAVVMRLPADLPGRSEAFAQLAGENNIPSLFGSIKERHLRIKAMCLASNKATSPARQQTLIKEILDSVKSTKQPFEHTQIAQSVAVLKDKELLRSFADYPAANGAFLANLAIAAQDTQLARRLLPGIHRDYAFSRLMIELSEPLLGPKIDDHANRANAYCDLYEELTGKVIIY
jgi:hypothetical protein